MASKVRDLVALASKRVFEDAGRRSTREVYERNCQRADNGSRAAIAGYIGGARTSSTAIWLLFDIVMYCKGQVFSFL